MTERLYSATELAAILHLSRQGLNYQERKGKIQPPKYIVGNTKAWTITQVREIKEAQKSV